MKKTIIAFTAGQVMQLVLLFVGQSLTYSTSLLAFCAIIGIMGTLMLLVGSVLASIEAIPNEFDEVAPLQEEIKVSNDKIERVPTEEVTIEKLFGKKAKE